VVSPTISERLRVKQLDRIQLNAAIQQLIESNGSLLEARQAVYEVGASLPIQSRVSGSMQMESPGDSMTGFTQEHGNVKIDDDKEQIRKVEFGTERVRIGSYKLWREKVRKGQFRIAIAHFWKLDEGTESMEEKPQIWCLACDQDGPIWFGERATLTVWDHFGLCLQRQLFVESWGANVGKHHHAGWVLMLG
jgi:hypothetical protein